MPPSRDEFARWREDTVTQWIFAAIRKGIDDNRAAWMDASWGNGVASQPVLSELRTRSDAYLALIETSYEGWLETNNDEEPR